MNRPSKSLKSWIDKPFKIYHADTFPGKTDSMTYFALTDALIAYAGKFDQPIIYFWPTKELVFLGMVDTKLPYIQSALPILSSNNYDYVVRNAGGLAVVSDPGVLNFSMIFPEDHDRLSINEAYDRMYNLISVVLNPYNVRVDAIEIEESYCPGDYDLSIHGKKIAGIAQRRVKGGISVMIYLSVNGDQQNRAKMIRDFYDTGLQGEDSGYDYPNIKPSVMTTLEDVLGVHITVHEAIDKIIHVINQAQETESLEVGEYNEYIRSEYQLAYEKMVKRNNKLLKDPSKERERLG